MLNVIIIIALVYGAACLLLFAAQKKLLYMPTGTPAVHAPAVVVLKADGATLKLSTRPVEGPHAVIYFGGNAEDVSMSLPHLAKAFPHHALYMAHYRGYGGSTGTPSEASLYADAQVVYEHVAGQHSRIIAIGRSLGSGIAVRLATTNALERLILVTPYDSIVNVAKQNFPMFPVAWLLTERFESWRHAPGVRAPTTIVAAEHDEVIPRERSVALLNAFMPDIARLQIIPGAGHNTISELPVYLEVLSDDQKSGR